MSGSESEPEKVEEELEEEVEEVKEKKKRVKRVIKPRQIKKGKVFPDVNQMLQLVNSIASKEESRIDTKNERHVYHRSDSS